MYQQRLKKWGTIRIGKTLEIDETIIDFNTAWTPPINIIKKLAELHKGYVFRLEYYVIALEYRCIYIAQMGKEGILVEENSWDMTDADKDELCLA